MIRCFRLFICLFSCLLFWACEPGTPVAVRLNDMALSPDMALLESDMTQPDLSIDMAIVDAMILDAEIPDYVEELAPSVAPDLNKVFITGQKDQFQLSWWLGGRLWTRSLLADLAPSPVDEAIELAVLEHSDPVMRRFVPPFIGQAYPLRPAGWPASASGYLLIDTAEAWLNYDLSSTEEPFALTLDPGLAVIADRTFGPTSPSSVLVVGQISDRVHAVGPHASDEAQPVGERDAPMPVGVSAMGHLWLFAYGDGHCISFTAQDTGVGEEVGNWKCFSDDRTHVLGRDSFSSDTQGPAMVRHHDDELRIWDPRPGVVTDPNLVIGPTMSEDSTVTSDALPANWTLHEELGHQVINTGGASLSFVGRFGATLAYTTVSAAVAQGETDMDEMESGNDADAPSDASEPDSSAEGANDNEASEDSDLSNEEMQPEGNEQTTEYWVLVSRDAVVVMERLPTSLGAFLVLDAEPAHLIWDGLNGELIGVPINAFTRTPLLPVEPDSCPGRSVEACGLADMDCDGDSEGGLCCPFSYAHSDVSTLSLPGAFQGDWFVSKTDLGALLAGFRRDRIEFLHVEGDSDTCFACATGLGALKAFAHSDAVVAVVAERTETEMGCPDTCSVSVVVPDDASAVDANEMEGSIEPNTDLILVHPSAGQLVFRDPGCSVQFLESISNGVAVDIIALCEDRALIYQVVDGTLSETPLTVDLSDNPLVWVGPPIKYIHGGRYAAEWLTAHGNEHILKAWRFSVDGLVEIPLPNAIANLGSQQRTMPIRMPILIDGLVTRKRTDLMSLEYLFDGDWRTLPSHLWARDIRFSKFEDFAISLTELRDPTAPGFDAIEQTLAVYAHDLSGIDSPWGQLLALESSPILGYSFQGVVLPEWDHYALEPNIWWAIGRDTVAPTIKRLGLSCQSTGRLVDQKANLGD